MKLISWNVNGLRSIYKKGFEDFVKKEKPDILCIQESKIGEDQLEALPPPPKGYTGFFSGAKKRGYSGVATYFKDSLEIKTRQIETEIGVKEFDQEGRFIITKQKDFSLYNIYYPSGTSGEERQNFKYKFLDAVAKHFDELPKSQKNKLIVCGDFNICHKEIDIHHPDVAIKRELSGFLPKERAWMDKFTEELGFVDSFRHINGKKKGIYSWWSYRANSRAKNLGWRIDYFFVAKPIAKEIKNAKILNKVTGSDHCPILLELK